MNLRTGLPYWRAISPDVPNFPALQGDMVCDVAVIGGGITGALVSYHLAREGVNALLVEKGDFGTGSTAASTGLLQYEIDTPLVDLIGKVGEQHAVHAYRRGRLAIGEMEQLVSELGDDCGFSRRNTFYFASDRRDAQDLRREFECQKHFGFDVELLEHHEVADRSSIAAPCALYSAGDGQIDPLRLTHRLLDGAVAAGLSIYGSTSVADIREEGERVVLETATGRVTARRVVFATGYESHKYTDFDVGTLHSTYAVASEPVSSWTGWPPDGCLIWETARPYFYARQTNDGRAIIGGEDTPYSDDHKRAGLFTDKIEQLQSRFRKLFPSIPFRPAYAWAGTFGETSDGLAYIGAPPGRNRAYFALGYGGNGITFSLIAARLITDLFVKRPNADAEIFRFGR